MNLANARLVDSNKKNTKGLQGRHLQIRED
jgi:hypothetical protein